MGKTTKGTEGKSVPSIIKIEKQKSKISGTGKGKEECGNQVETQKKGTGKIPQGRKESTKKDEKKTSTTGTKTKDQRRQEKPRNKQRRRKTKRNKENGPRRAELLAGQTTPLRTKEEDNHEIKRRKATGQ